MSFKVIMNGGGCVHEVYNVMIVSIDWATKLNLMVVRRLVR